MPTTDPETFDAESHELSAGDGWAETERVTAPHIDIVFDGPPGPRCGRFVEVEDASGASIRVGTWMDRRDGFWVLRIPTPLLAPGDAQTYAAARAMYAAAEAVKHAGGSVEISGVKIEPCDAYGRTASQRTAPPPPTGGFVGAASRVLAAHQTRVWMDAVRCTGCKWSRARGEGVTVEFAAHQAEVLAAELQLVTEWAIRSLAGAVVPMPTESDARALAAGHQVPVINRDALPWTEAPR